jgi:ankyrin repeat protein
MAPDLLPYRFRWVFCQLEVLRHCLPSSIRQTLDQLPESLDATYLHVLSQIPQANQAHAHRLLQCLMVAVRPLRVEELAEVLAFEFDAAPGVIPMYRLAWRLDDQTQTVLSTCSSLVAIVDGVYGRQVQFSHFSVKEFLMSNRLGDFSQYHIHPISAHTNLTQACLGVLLHLEDCTDKESVTSFPLAEYAARHWVEHARFKDVASCVKAGIETLFDSDKPHFASWVEIYDIDDLWYGLRHFSHVSNSRNPLYYSVLCGFYDLVKQLAIKHPRYINAICGRYGYPLFAAISENHIEVAELLIEHGASVDVQETTGETILLKVLSLRKSNLVNKVKLLLKHGADVNARDDTLTSSLHLAVCGDELEVAGMLIKHKADVNSQNNKGKTPLHILSERPANNGDVILNHARLLLERGAEVNKRDKNNETPLHVTMRRVSFKLAQILLEHGADVSAENNDGKTPLQILLERRANEDCVLDDCVLDNARLLLERGAEVNKRDKNYDTPLHVTIRRVWFKFAQILLEHGADATAENNDGKTPLHILSERQANNEDDVLNHARLLLERGAEVNRRDRNMETPLHLAIGRDLLKLARILLEQGADANARNNDGKTPLRILLEHQICDKSGVQVGDVLDHMMLWEHGAAVTKPIHLEIGTGTRMYEFAWNIHLLVLNTDVSVEQKASETSVHPLLPGQYGFQEERGVRVFQPPLEHAVVENNAQEADQLTSLQYSLPEERLDIDLLWDVERNFGRSPLSLVAERRRNIRQDLIYCLRLLLERGADVHAPDNDDVTPLHLASFFGRVDFTRVLLDRGAAANSTSKQGRTPLHSVAEGRYLCSHVDCVRVARLLLGRGADVNASDEDNKTPLHLASYHRKVEVVRALLDGGGDANSKDDQGRTPLHVVAEGYAADNDVIAHILLERGADVNALDDNNETPLHVASYFGTVKMVLVLLNAGANANARNSQGQTALHVVSQCPYHSRSDGVGVARILLEHSADVNAQDKNHATPSDFVAYHGRTKIASLFVGYGGKTNAEIIQRLAPRQLGLKRVLIDDEPRVKFYSPYQPPKRMSATSNSTSLTVALQDRKSYGSVDLDSLSTQGSDNDSETDVGEP